MLDKMLNKMLNRKNIIGLEINDNEIKAVELYETKNEITLVNFGNESLPEGAVKEGIVADPHVVGQALINLWEERGFNSLQVVIGVANQSVLVRFANFPKVDRQKLDNMIKYQASEYMPVSLDEETVVFDYSIINENTQDDESDMWEVLLVAGKRDMIDGFMDCLRYAGLSPLEVEVLPLSLLRLFNIDNSYRVAAVMDISYSISNFIIVDNKKPRLARMMPTTYEEGEAEDTEKTDEHDVIVVDEVAASDELAPEEVENEAETSETWSSNVVNDIRVSIDFYHSQGDVDLVEKVLLCGKNTDDDQLFTSIKSQVGVEVEVLDPLQVLAITDMTDSQQHDSQEDFVEYALCFCLAYKGLEV